MLQWKTIVIYKSHQLYQQEARETDMDDVRTALKHDRNQVKSFFALDEKITLKILMDTFHCKYTMSNFF